MDWDKLRAVGERNREHSREKTRGEGKVQLMDKAWPISGMKIKDSDDWAAQHMLTRTHQSHGRAMKR